MSKRTNAAVPKRGTTKKTAMPVSSVGIGQQNFMPNFGMDIPLGMNMGPAFANPGAPSRPGHPATGAKKAVNTKPGPPGMIGKKLRGSPPALSTPPRPGQKSKAGIPPPPSHGGRSMAPLSGVMLNSLPTDAKSPTLLKAPPLPKIGANKVKKELNSRVEDNISFSDIELVLYGHICEDLPEAPSRLVRVFLSSTFSDMKAERNEIWTTVYPALRSHCLSHGLDFSFVDMRWGVLDYTTNHHKTEDVVLDEVRRTDKVSCATSFLSIIGHRYGSVVNANVMSCSKFEALLDSANKNNIENRELLEKWYKRDDNNVPPLFKLQPISMLLPDYQSTDEEKKSAATSEWNRIGQALLKVNYEATRLAVEAGKLEIEELDDLDKSVTTTEIETGIIHNPHASGTSYSIYRQLEGIEADAELPATAKFIDVENEDGKTVVNKANLQKITRYIAQPISKILMAESRKTYKVAWHTGGIPTDISQQTESDRSFLSTLSHDLTNYLIKATDAHVDSLANRPKEYKIPSCPIAPTGTKQKHTCTPECMMKCALANKNALVQQYKQLEMVGTVALPDSLYKEILHHLHLAEVKTKLFCGRKEQLADVKKYLKSTAFTSPLMVYGASGGGKTPFAGQIAKNIHSASWLGKRAVTVVRLIGSSAATENIQSTLRSVMIQLSCAYQMPYRIQENESLKQLALKLKHLLETISYTCMSECRPCVIILDGLEHLSPMYNTHSLEWIPAKLPPSVYLITTFNPDEYNLLASAKARFDRFLVLPPLTLNDMLDYVKITLEYHKRTLTTHQMQLLTDNLTAHPYPIYGQLLANLAIDTPSYADITSKLMLKKSEDAVNAFLDKLEKRYGTKFVSYCLAYITCGHSGISEIELEDVLSCSDEVLVEVYVYHEPPVPGTIRLPPHLWPMLRKELNQFLLEKSTNDYILISWYHKTISTIVKKRYLSDPEVVRKYHQQLSEIYMSRNGVHRTITLTRLRKPITIENADRQIALYSTAGKLPVRILLSIPHHLTNMFDMDKLKKMTVCNLDYIAAVWQQVDLEAMSNITSGVIQDFTDSVDSDKTFNDLELNCMLAFYNHYLSSFSDSTYNEEVMRDFCIVLLGAFSRSDQTPAINCLLDKSLEYVESFQRPLIVPTDQCCLFGQDRMKWQFSGCARVGDVENDTSLISLVSTSQKTVDTADLNASRVYTLSRTSKITQVRLSQRRVFALTDQAVHIQSFTTTESVKASVKTDSITKGECLNKVMAISESARLICLGGKDKIGVLEDKTSLTSDIPQYKVLSSLSLGGVKSTEAIVFTNDEKYTISAHTIAAKNRSVGGLVKWDYETKTTESRLSLPGPILKNCLYLLPDDDRLICACSHNEILIVSMKEQKIVKKLYGGTSSWIDMAMGSSLLGAVFDNSDIKVWDVQDENCRTFSSEFSPTALSVSEALSQAFVGNQKGSVEFYNLQDCKLVRVIQISALPIRRVKVVSDDYLLVHDTDNDVFILHIERLLEAEVDSEEQAPNTLGCSKRGVFSADGESVLVERSLTEAASLYNTTDLTRIDVSTSTGFHKMALCGGSSYLVGEKDESLRIWDLAKGGEIFPPPGVKELTDSLVPYHASPSEPVIMLASDGVLTQWNVSDGRVNVSQYIGTDVQEIRMSDSLIALCLRSGTTDNWVLHLMNRASGDTILTEEREETICDVRCNNHTALFVCGGSAFLMSSKDLVTTKLELPAPVQHIQSSSQYYVTVYGQSTVALVCGKSGKQLCAVDMKEKVSGVIFTSDEYTVVSLSLGNVQLIKWQVKTSGTVHTLSNKIQTTCGHLAAFVDVNRNMLLVYGILLDESRLFSFDLKGF